MEKPKLKISQVGSRGIPGHRGGIEQVVEAIAPRLAELGHESSVHCATWGEYKESEYKGVKLHYTFGPQSKYFDTPVRSFFAMFKEIFSSTDIIHIHGSGSAPLALLAKLFGKKVVVTVHGLDWQRRKWNAIGSWSLQFGEWAAAKFPHRTLVVGQALKRVMDERYNCNSVFIPNGVERRQLREPNKIKQYGVGHKDYILFLARLVPEKQPHVLVEAYRKLAERNGIKLVVAGPAWYSKEYVDSVHKIADNDPDVIFTGEVDNETLEELYSNCYSYVLPSEVEGMSLALLDSMAYGNTIITSDIPANADAIADCGLTFPVGDSDKLAEQLQKIISSSDLAEELRQKAIARVTDTYNWDNIAKQWEEVYLELM